MCMKTLNDFHECRHICSFACFLEYLPLFRIIICMKTVNDFQKPKVQPQLVIWLIFSQFQPGVANESVAYIKKRVIQKQEKSRVDVE